MAVITTSKWKRRLIFFFTIIGWVLKYSEEYTLITQTLKTLKLNVIMLCFHNIKIHNKYIVHKLYKFYNSDEINHKIKQIN